MRNLLKKILSRIMVIIILPFRQILKARFSGAPIVILSFKFLGDTVFTIPAIQKIKLLNPGKKIIVCCYSVNMEIYKLYFNSLEYSIFNKEDLRLDDRKINTEFIRAALHIRAIKPSVVFDMTSCWKSAIMNFLIGAGSQVGFGNSLLSGFYDNFYTEEPKNQIELFLNSVNNYYNDFSESGINIIEDDNPNISICIIPFAGWKAKEWNLRKFIDLSRLLAEYYDTKIVYEDGKILEEIIADSGNGNVNFVPTKNIKELIEEIKKVTFVITNDTGPLYISYLLGKSSFSLFGPTNPKFHLFDKERQHYIQKRISCIPGTNEKLCFTYGGRNGCPSNECMQLLEVNEVFENIISYISEIKSRS